MVAEMLIRVGESRINKGATMAWMSETRNKGKGYRSDDSAIRTKDGCYRSVKNGAI
jgi:hypothetical protein